MSYKLIKHLSLRSNYGSKRIGKPKYIVWHYTGNKSDTVNGNLNFFRSGYRGASAHFFVDEKTVGVSVPESYVAWSVGGGRYSDYLQTGGAKYYNKCTNFNSISIEICASANYKPNDKTMENVVTLTKKLMNKYKIPASRVIRHFDVNGKHCPAWGCCSRSNIFFYKKWHDKLTAKKIHTYGKKPGKYKVLKTPRVIRENANVNSRAVGYIIDNGIYTITKVSGHYGYLKSGKGWINLRDDYVKKV